MTLRNLLSQYPKRQTVRLYKKTATGSKLIKQRKIKNLSTKYDSYPVETYHMNKKKNFLSLLKESGTSYKFILDVLISDI